VARKHGDDPKKKVEMWISVTEAITSLFLVDVFILKDHHGYF
jgi:hypothetical protein